MATLSERSLLELVRRAGTISRADLTRASGLSVPGAKGLIDGLVERGILTLGPAMTRGRGQPSASVSLTANHVYAIGLSIMVDGFSVVIMDLAGRVIGVQEVQSFPLELEFVERELTRLLPRMLSEQSIPWDRVFGVGLSMTGPLTGVGSRVNPPLSLGPAWAEVELDRYFSAALKLPVWIDNDANCAALAELLFGIGHKVDDFVYLHFTDGFAAGLVVAGKVLRGANGNAGELGRLLAMTGLPRPSLEDLRQRLVSAGLAIPDLGSLLRRYEPSWPQIDEWIQDVRGSITVAIAAATAMLDPRAIVFGSRLPVDLAQRLSAAVEFEQHPRRGLSSPLPELLVHSNLQHAATIGAAALPFKAHYFA
ncbi:MAG: ROK family protein [Inhella sp.]